MSKKLEACRNCETEIELKIRRCPYCGILNPTVKTKDIIKTIFIVIFTMYTYTYFIK